GSQTHPCKNTGIYYRTNGRGDNFILSAPIYSWVRIVETLTDEPTLKAENTPAFSVILYSSTSLKAEGKNNGKLIVYR
ncbi:MAG: hypothetical protein IKJ10_07850, partial [Bacteroidaceae bacterium]|nr:hypothetical protein [Bacteroidaceae bacterium]